MGRTVVELFYDVVSPYSWLGFEVLCRYQHVWNIDLRLRPAFLGGIMQATGSLGAMRFITAVGMTQPQYLEPLSREFWISFWSQHEDISQIETMQAIARQAGLSPELAQKALEMISSPAVKNQLKETTEEAIKYGAFGMPAVVTHVNGEPQLFFGSDRLELLGSIIGEKWMGPVPSVPSPKM
ncbi:glutathione S-transferase kappa 1 isoform X2 [Indicator indicator]|uniref:glutathione S-transferase kappa 1 isoform X2 n=1 Tax=Indicator indicator TaxID=1002788 RepID=UPI0023E01EAB|nr:glutathione S-transferase kappa 1 isoform X2 [Indicator indicator]